MTSNTVIISAIKFLPILLLNYNFVSIQTCLCPATLTVRRIFSEKFVEGIGVKNGNMGLRMYGGNGVYHVSDSNDKSEHEMSHKFISEKYLNDILMQLEEFCEHSKYYRQVRFHFRIWTLEYFVLFLTTQTVWSYYVLISEIRCLGNEILPLHILTQVFK